MSIREIVLDEVPGNYDYYLAETVFRISVDALESLLHHEMRQYQDVIALKVATNDRPYANYDRLYTFSPADKALAARDIDAPDAHGAAITGSILTRALFFEGSKKLNPMFDTLYGMAQGATVPDFYKMALLRVRDTPIFKSLQDLMSTMALDDATSFLAAVKQLHTVIQAAGTEVQVAEVPINIATMPDGRSVAYLPDDFEEPPNPDRLDLN